MREIVLDAIHLMRYVGLRMCGKSLIASVLIADYLPLLINYWYVNSALKVLDIRHFK